MPYKDRQVHNEYMQRRYKAKRDAVVARLGGKCAVCKSENDLEIDHINPDEKTINVAKLILATPEKLNSELAKCQLLCSIHHQAKTSAEQGVSHGGGVSGKRNCRCQLCRSKRSQYNRAYKQQLDAE